MPIRSLIFLFLMSAGPAFAENQTVLQKSNDDFLERDRGAYGLSAFLELRASRDERDLPINRTNENIHELSLGGNYQLDKTLNFNVELTVEQLYYNNSTFFAKQAFLDWAVWPEYVRFRLGQQFLPVGLINERDNWWSSLPPFYETLLAQSKGIDLGGILDVYPLKNRFIYAEASVWSGRLVRDIDQRNETPAERPWIVSVKSHGQYYDAFASYLEHHLSYFNKVKASGVGGEARSPVVYGFQGFLLGEYWTYLQPQDDGPNQRNRALLLYGQLQYWRIALGYRWSQSAGEVVSALGQDNLPMETSQLALIDGKIADSFNLRLERVVETDSELLRDQWVARALVHWDM